MEESYRLETKCNKMNKRMRQGGYKAEVWSFKRKELPRPPGGRSLVYRRISIHPTNTPRNLGHVYRCGVGITKVQRMFGQNTTPLSTIDNAIMATRRTTTPKSTQPLMAKGSLDLWHRRLAYLGQNIVKTLPTHCEGVQLEAATCEPEHHPSREIRGDNIVKGSRTRKPRREAYLVELGKPPTSLSGDLSAFTASLMNAKELENNYPHHDRGKT
jgi:hypothetical protein